MIRALLMLLFIFLPMQKDEGLRTTVSGTIFCREGRGTNSPLGGAALSLIVGKDTLNTVSDNSGKFSFSFPQAFEVTILARYQGFEDYCETYQLFGDHTAIAIRMNHNSQQLDAAKIVDEIPFVRSEADTVIFNMAAVEKMEGDRALALLMQIPGFTTDKGKLMVWGEYVDKTYINGKLIYGDDPMTALKLLNADEVRDVRIYDTQSPADKLRGVKNSKKRRVIDVRTFRQFFSAVDVQVQARAGSFYDEKEHGTVKPFRFSLGSDFDSNREMQQIALSVNGNNIDDGKNGIEVVKGAPSTLYYDKMTTDASVKFVRKWKDAEWGNSLSMNYNFHHEDNSQHSETIIDRTGAEGGLIPLCYEESRSALYRRGYHVASVDARLHQTPLKDIDFHLGISFDDVMTDDLGILSSDADAVAVLHQRQTSGTRDRGFSIAPIITWSNLNAKSGWTPSFKFSCSLSNNLAQSFTIDTLKSSATRRYLEGSGNGTGKYFSGAFAMRKTISDTGLLTTELEWVCNAVYSNGRKKALTVDNLLSEGEKIDYINSFDYTWNELKYTVGGGLTMATHKGQMLALRAGIISDRQLDVESFPEDICTPERYTWPYASVSFTPPLRKDKLFVNYYLSGEIPALEQIRERVDNKNPLRLQIGNPNLKATLKHAFGIGYFPHVSSEGSFFALQSVLQVDQRPIVDRIQYYAQSRTLNAWGVDYEIPAGGTLTGYENADLSFSTSLSASFGCRVKPLKGLLSSQIRFTLRKSPEYNDSFLNFVMGYGPKLDLSLSTMPVKFLRMSLSNVTSCTKEVNASQAVLSEEFVESCSVTTEIRFLKYAFCNANYSMTLFRSLNGVGMNLDAHNMRCAVGALFWDGKLGVSISGSNLLDRAVDYSTRTTGSEFLQRTSASLGRYFLLNIAYRFDNKE